MSVLGTIGEALFPRLAQTVKRYTSKPEEHGYETRLGMFGGDILEGLFPNLYSSKQRKRSIKKQTDVSLSVDVLANEVNVSNELVVQSIELQKQQNELLSQILNGIKSGGMGGGPSLIEDILGSIPGIPDLRRRGPRGAPAGAAPKGGPPKGTPAEEAKRTPKSGVTPKEELVKPKEGYKFNEKTQRWYNTKTGRMVSAAEAIEGKVEQKVAQKVEKKFSMDTLKKFIKYIALKKGKEFAARVGAKLIAAAGMAATGVGAIIDVFFIALNIYDAYEIYQLWQEFTAAGEPDIPETKEQDSKLDDDLSKIGPDGQRLITGSIIQFIGKDVYFEAKEMVITANDIIGLGGGTQAPSILASVLPAVAPEDAKDREKAVADVGARLKGQDQGGIVQEVQDKVAAIRKMPISPELKQVLQTAGREAGVSVRVTSGGQPQAPGGPRTGSTRHDLGNAADLDVISGGRVLNDNKPDDVKIKQTFVTAARKAGATGIGAGMGYMGPEKVHVGFGTKATWGGAPWLPAYAEGTKYVPKAGPAIVGERGPEMVVSSSGKKRMTGKGPAVENLNQGDSVIPTDTLLSGIKIGASFIPGVGQAVAGISAAGKLLQGDVKGAIKEGVGAIPGSKIATTVGGFVLDKALDQVDISPKPQKQPVAPKLAPAPNLVKPDFMQSQDSAPSPSSYEEPTPRQTTGRSTAQKDKKQDRKESSNLSTSKLLGAYVNH